MMLTDPVFAPDTVSPLDRAALARLEVDHTVPGGVPALIRGAAQARMFASEHKGVARERLATARSARVAGQARRCRVALDEASLALDRAIRCAAFAQACERAAAPGAEAT